MDCIVEIVMNINKQDGAFVTSSGKNMGAFKGVGFPEEIADYFRIDKYKGYMWTAHNRFPTNTPGWWGDAHPFCILDKACVHNGEITSYGTNARWLKMYNYLCLLKTDTEVISYIFDKLQRKDNLSIEDICTTIAPPLWEEIDRNNNTKQKLLRQIYGPAVVNGPFGIVLTHNDGAIILNDRNKLRPVVCAIDGDRYYASSEECSIRLLSPNVDKLWSPNKVGSTGGGSVTYGRVYSF
jgi:glutamate synthase domain-containing protein 1